MSPAQELQLLRISLRRVAEAAIRQGATLTIPGASPVEKRGWNHLCSDLASWIEEPSPPPAVELSQRTLDIVAEMFRELEQKFEKLHPRSDIE